MPEEFRTPDVFDGIMFNDEFLALELRLNELWDQVKHFIIVEAGETFTGIPKPLNFTRNQAAFKRYAEKITVVTLSGFPLGMRDPWERVACNPARHPERLSRERPVDRFGLRRDSISGRCSSRPSDAGGYSSKKTHICLPPASLFLRTALAACEAVVGFADCADDHD
jgi:hypothetical protein